VAALVASLSLGRAARGAGSPGDRKRAEFLARIGEARYRLALLRPGVGDLNESLRALEEARRLDPANLRALGCLGLARFEAAGRGAAAGPGSDSFAAAREPLEELFRLSSGWVDPATRRLLADVTASLDEALEGGRAATENARTWWRAWKARLGPAETASPSPSGDALPLVEALRAGAVAWERERAAEKLATGKATATGAVEALALALRGDASPWVRAAAAKALSALAPAGWDVRLADALRNDSAVWVRRTCAEALAPGSRGGRVGEAARDALVRALETDTPRVAGAAAQALGALGGVEAELVRALESPSALVRGSASAALRLHSDAAAIAAKLRPLMDSDRTEVRAGALRAVGPGPGRLPGEMTEKIALLLADPDARVRGAAAAALCRRDVSGMRGKLRGLFADEDPSVRLAAAETLLNAGDKSARPVLVELATSGAPLRTFGGPDGMRTVGDAAKRILAERGREDDTPRADGE
jgi:HEAT repeat protein